MTSSSPTWVAAEASGIELADGHEGQAEPDPPKGRVIHLEEA